MCHVSSLKMPRVKTVSPQLQFAEKEQIEKDVYNGTQNRVRLTRIPLVDSFKIDLDFLTD